MHRNNHWVDKSRCFLTDYSTESFNFRFDVTLLIFQIVQIVIASLCLIFGNTILSYAGANAEYDNHYYYSDSLAYFGTGIWTSAFVSIFF